MKTPILHVAWLSFLGLGVSVVVGCGQTDSSKPTADVSHASQDTHGAGEASHDHSDWWCIEHGVPEKECAMCNAKLAAEYREKGDWCDEHNRPASLCFKCDPEKAEKFAALYEAKYGEKPPAPTE